LLVLYDNANVVIVLYYKHIIPFSNGSAWYVSFFV